MKDSLNKDEIVKLLEELTAISKQARSDYDRISEKRNKRSASYYYGKHIGLVTAIEEIGEALKTLNKP